MPLCQFCEYFDFKYYQKTYNFKCSQFKKIPKNVKFGDIGHIESIKNELPYKRAIDKELKARGDFENISIIIALENVWRSLTNL